MDIDTTIEGITKDAANKARKIAADEAAKAADKEAPKVTTEEATTRVSRPLAAFLPQEHQAPTRP